MTIYTVRLYKCVGLWLHQTSVIVMVDFYVIYVINLRT